MGISTNPMAVLVTPKSQYQGAILQSCLEYGQLKACRTAIGLAEVPTC